MAVGPRRIAVGTVFAVALGIAFGVWPRWYLFAMFALQVFLLMMEVTDVRRARRASQRPELETRPAQRASERRDDAVLGTIEWRDDEEAWCVRVQIDGEEVVVSFRGDRYDGPAGDSKKLWLATKPCVLQIWTEVVRFTQSWATESGIPPFDASEFAMTTLHVDPDAALGGEIVVSFEIATDPDGAYFVPVRDGAPQLVHRDS